MRELNLMSQCEKLHAKELYLSGCSCELSSNDWVAVKELNLSCYIGETRLFTIYTHYGNC